MSEKNRDRLIAGILFYKEAIKNSDNKEYIEKCQKKIEEFLNQLKHMILIFCYKTPYLHNSGHCQMSLFVVSQQT